VTTLVAAIIGTAVLPTLVANKFYLPRHLLPKDEATLHTPAHMAEVEEALEDSEVRS
jgi:glutathione-regulated potassium-efflux system ancillary protein KefC